MRGETLQAATLGAIAGFVACWAVMGTKSKATVSYTNAMTPGHIVDAEYTAMCSKVVAGKSASFSQAYQDWWLYHNVFTGQPINSRTYLDLGANDPYFISNTLFFDKCLGWKGVCVEPNPKYVQGFKGRSCTHVKNCLWNTKKTMKFNMKGDALGGIADAAVAKTWNNYNCTDCTETQCLPLVDILRAQGVRSAGFASLDIEGAETVVLQDFPFAEFDIKAWVVETNTLDLFKQKSLDLLFLRNGYSKVDSTLCCSRVVDTMGERGDWLDDIYVKKSKPTKYPAIEKRECSKEESKWSGLWCELGMPAKHLNHQG